MAMAGKFSLISAFAQIPVFVILFSASVVQSITSSIALTAVRVIDYLTGTPACRGAWHAIRYTCEAVPCVDWDAEVDVQKTLKASNFPIKPAELVQLCKEVAAQEFGCLKPEMLADDFHFVAPVVGPLSKREFTKAFSGFDVRTAFPDQKSNFFGFAVDPQEPNRVWFMSRARSTHTGPLKFGGRIIAPTNKHVVHVPQALSMLFTPEGLCYTLTVGYSMDRRVGNTGGLGGLFGPLFAVGHGLPFSEGKPWAPSLRLQAFERVQKALLAFGVEM